MIFFFTDHAAWIAFAAASAIDRPADSAAALAQDAGNRWRARARVLSCPSITKIRHARPRRCRPWPKRWRRSSAAQHFEIVIISDSTQADRVDQRIARGRPLAARPARDHAGLVSPSLAQHRPQSRQRRRVRQALGRALRLHDRARRRQPHVGRRRWSNWCAACRAMRTSASCRRCRCCIGHCSLFSRIQQFAGRVYGGLIARGVAAWSRQRRQLTGATTRSFASRRSPQACGMPQLPGRKPFGGHVLSHDFVEAALMRRAGWKVRMAPDLDGSWEESPPSLIDVAVRDRRWAQGNLQHSKIIGADGLSVNEPRALLHRHHELPVLAAVADAAAGRLRADVAGDADPAGIFQPQLPAVPGLAASSTRRA